MDITAKSSLARSTNSRNGKSKISIITVVLNCVEHIEQTIKSVISQNYRNLEYIIIDGGSTDGTIDVIRKYDSEITYWQSQQDRGISDAFNKGILKATGDIIGIINADDWYEPNAFEVVIQYYNTNPGFGVFYGRTRFVKNSKNNYYPDNPLAHASLFQEMSLAHPSVFVTKKVYEKLDSFDLKYRLAMDYDFLLRAILSNVRFKFMNLHVANFRPGGLTYQYFNKSLEECEKIRQILLFDQHQI